MGVPRAPRLWPGPVRGLAALACAAALAGCVGTATGPGAVRPVPAPPPADPALPTPGPESVAMRGYFANVAQMLQGQGLLRQDTAPRDAPFTARQLTENFIRIALYDEYAREGGSIVARQSASRLRRWAEPVRMNVEFGASVPQAQRRADSARIGGYAGQLARATGHPVMVSDRAPNFTVMVLNEGERRGIGPRLATLVPGIDAGALRAVADLSPATFCIVFAFSEPSSATYTRAVAVIRGEHPDILRLSCIHEELAQGMGLANDSPAARPSIFNDDEEFALLTRHDEMLLRILYDPRLRPGMTEAEARPIVETIAAELMGGES
ncbi:DUF2927 domain-containing protein [Candidatus Falkowbacteria bacterium]|nr:DUF2927 domain-containing protein [Candidatus Falkowbacteria bacterium]